MHRLFLALTLFVTAAGAYSQQVSFKDPALDKIVHKYIPDQTPDSPLTADRVGSVILVSGETGQTVHDLSGLEACKKLTYLYLPDAQITDLSPLAKLTSLESVTIRGAKLHDLSPLAGLTNLQYLDLANDDISDIRPLAGLKKLTHLNLSGNHVMDLSPLSGLPMLQELIVANNQISDLTPLAGFKNNKVADLSPLKSLKDWRYLYLDQNQIKDLAPLVSSITPASGPEAEVVPFRTLTISGNPLTAEARSKELPELEKRVLNVIAN